MGHKKQIIKSFYKPDNLTQPAIDSHAHLIKLEKCEQLITNFNNDVICCVINMAGDEKSIDNAIDLSSKYDNIYFFAGIHPYDYNLYNDHIKQKLLSLKNIKGFVGIGEIGLDYYRELDITKQDQLNLFIDQLKIADSLQVPVSLHIRDAHTDAINILKQNKHLLNNGGIIHCFSGTLIDAKEYLKLGFYISFSGSVTFLKKKEDESELMKIAKQLPLNKILIETDSPFLCPVPFRGAKNEPKYVVWVANAIATSKNISVNNLIKQTNKNLCKLLKIKPCNI